MHRFKTPTKFILLGFLLGAILNSILLFLLFEILSPYFTIVDPVQPIAIITITPSSPPNLQR
jgi:hypothetical protein